MAKPSSPELRNPRRELALAVAAVLVSTAAVAQEPPPFGLNTPDGGITGVDPTVAEPPVPAEPQPEPQPEPTPEEPPPAFTHRTDINGYLATRTSYARSRVNGLFPTDDVPQWATLLELNGQLKVTFHPNGFAYADVSLIGQAGFDYRGLDKAGNETFTLLKDPAAVRPLISINELYALYEVAPWLNFMLGKKRIVWGPGQAFNPTDLLNVRKDPTDPTFQRAGAWLVRAEVPLETMAFTFMFAPQVTEQAVGIPYGFILYPDWDKNRPDTDAHYLFAARAYFLIADADVNVIGYFSNKYYDDFEKKLRVGGSFSRIFFTTWETHAEFLVQQGSARQYIKPQCVGGTILDAQGCLASGGFVDRKLNDSSYFPQLLAGVRKTFDDDSFISVEYMYQADGYTRAQFQDQINALDLFNQARALGINVPSSIFSTGTARDGIPSRFSFAPTVQHYAFITAQKPRLKDDFTLQLVLIANLQDLSTLWSPSVTWSATEWLQLSLLGFIPLQGPDALAATVKSTGGHASEYGLLPQLARVFIEARLFY